MVKHENITTLLRTDYRTLPPNINWNHLIYTGPIDEFYDFRLGPLPYRSLRFEREDIDREYFQPFVQVNYPNNFDFTRIVEVKHVTGQQIPVSTIVREYPHDFRPGYDPFYPIPSNQNQSLYNEYAALARREINVTFVGRLATYRYYNMDQIVGMALSEWEKLDSALGRNSVRKS